MTAWVGDPSKWCLGMEDLARWCLDEVPEEPRAGAPPHYTFLPRSVYVTAENAGSGNKFRAGDLFYHAWQTRSTKAHLDGTVSWRGLREGGDANPNAPDLWLQVRIRRSWSVLSLSGGDVDPQYREVEPLELTPKLDSNNAWIGLEATFGPWWLLFEPSYATDF